MNIKSEDYVYKEDFDSRQDFIEYIDGKIDTVQNDYDEFHKIAKKEFQDTFNSKLLAKSEEDIEEIEDHFKQVIDKLEELREEIRDKV